MTPGTEELPTEMGALAGKLTEAQREAFVLAEVREPIPFMPNYWPISMPGRRMMGGEADQMVKLGLVSLPICVGPRSGWPVYEGEITLLGLALRAHLQANPIPNSDSKEEGR